MGQAKNLAEGQDGLGKPIKIQYGMQDFDSLSHPSLWDRPEKDNLIQKKDALKQKMTFLKQKDVL